MVQIRQHGEEGRLYDIESFIPLLETKLSIYEWEIAVEWCSGEGAEEIERSFNEPIRISHEAFRDLYKGIFQTIDGLFIVRAREGSVRLLAVDSSYWEVESDVPNIEREFEHAFGLYHYPFA